MSTSGNGDVRKIKKMCTGALDAGIYLSKKERVRGGDGC